MNEFYKLISQSYDKVGISDYSITVGKSILEFFKKEHSNREFKKNLDICCGTGTLCNFFEENGIKSKGVDISEDMLNIAREKYPEIEFIGSDIILYEDNAQYDFITCTNDALNYILDIDDLKTVFKNVNSWLYVDGYFIFDLIAGHLMPEYLVKQQTDDFKIIYKSNILDNDLIHMITYYYENDELVWQHEDYDERIYNTEDILNLLNDTGFVLERCSQEFYMDTRHLKLKFIARKAKLNLK